MPTIKKIQISVSTDPQNPEEAKKIVKRARDQDRLSGRNVFSGKGPIYVKRNEIIDTSYAIQECYI